MIKINKKPAINTKKSLQFIQINAILYLSNYMPG